MVALTAILGLTACDRSVAPPTADATAIATAEQRAIDDVDAAHAEAERAAPSSAPTDGPN